MLRLSQACGGNAQVEFCAIIIFMHIICDSYDYIHDY